MATSAEDIKLSLAERLWIYQGERFPLFKTAVLLAAFTAASINVSAMLGGRALPGGLTYILAWLTVLILFFQMRACDEWKDSDDDHRYRPERPIPRGLVTLKMILTIGVGLIPIALLATATISGGLLILLLIAWIWLVLMTVEFFAPEWLKARPFLYLVSHMLIMPLIDLYVTGAEWVPAAGEPPSGIWLFLLLSFLNGCVIEIGRKLYAPENEREGVETYTALMGVRRATNAWVACMVAGYLVLLALGWILGTFVAFAIVAGIGLAAAIYCAMRFTKEPTPANQKLVDGFAGGWVLICYVTAGYLPLIVGGG